MRALIVLCALAAPALADDPRQAAEALMKKAQQTGDPAAFVACGTAYFDLYNKDPNGASNDEVLYNAGVCFERGKSAGAAVMAFELIRRYYPRSQLYRMALLELARVNAQIARYDRAAEGFEEYANKYAGEKDAFGALENAILFRRVIGDDRKTIADVELFARMFAQRNPQAVAEARWSLIPIYERSDRKHAIAELRALAQGKLDDARRIAVLVELGDLLRTDSCPVKLYDGLCITLNGDNTRCGGVRVELPPRDARTSLRAYEQATQVAVNDAVSAHLVAMAQIARADADLEQLYVAPSGDAAAKLVDRYRKILADSRDPISTVAASERIGLVHEAIRGASGDCTTTTPLATAMLGAFSDCVDKATQLGVADDHTWQCYGGASALDPVKFPWREVIPAIGTVAIEVIGEPPPEPRAPELAAAYAMFDANEKAGWKPVACKDTAAAFALKRMPEAHFMAGTSYQRCGQASDAQREYEAAGDYAAARSSLGAVQWQTGHSDAARASWNGALKTNAKLFAAHVDLAIAELREYQALADRKGSPLADDIQLHAASALAIDPTRSSPRLVLAAIAIEAKRFDLAEYELGIALDHDPRLVTANVLRGLVKLRRNDVTAALPDLEQAAKLDPSSGIAQLAAGLTLLRVHRYSAALTRLDAAPPSYQRSVGRGIALRATGKRAEAIAAYTDAIRLDGSRAEAFYDLGLVENAGDTAARARAKDDFRKATAIDPTLTPPP